MKQDCFGCRFFARDNRECRRYPPVPVGIVECNSGAINMGSSIIIKTTIREASPKRMGGEWCGEWQVRESECKSCGKRLSEVLYMLGDNTCNECHEKREVSVQ